MYRSSLALLAVALPFAAEAAAPPLVPITGFLTDDLGAPIDTSVALEMALYVDATGTTALWSEVQAVDVDNGQFTAYLGADDPLLLETFRDNGTLYLGVTIGTSAEMTPRFQLATAPYAAFAEYATTADDALTVGGIDPVDFRLVADPIQWSEIAPTSLPVGMADGDNDTTYTAGTGLTLTGTAFTADQTVIEGWATDVAYDTVAELQADLDTVYAARQGCSVNQILVANSAGAWVCTAHGAIAGGASIGGNASVGGSLTVTGAIQNKHNSGEFVTDVVTNPSTTANQTYTLLDMRCSGHWGSYYAEIELITMYYIPGVRRYQYYCGNSGNYTGGGVLVESGSSTANPTNGRPSLAIQYVGNSGFQQSGIDMHDSRLVVTQPAYVGTYARVKYYGYWASRKAGTSFSTTEPYAVWQTWTN